MVRVPKYSVKSRHRTCSKNIRTSDIKIVVKHFLELRKASLENTTARCTHCDSLVDEYFLCLWRASHKNANVAVVFWQENDPIRVEWQFYLVSLSAGLPS